eukprot:CAMPEP_0197863048 /NCGR_PEP_ID=MMETSP1438-20131217/40215_1 /TAXON_ID=1461541 /ORGANISM="Pterosperma sp., Strain CCMP1384" /LENGTH=252 /DNA_ID=CAMNT_0043480793 /DNA_START=290 /DNA_END=1048 /DNA_ORIENTATION=+
MALAGLSTFALGQVAPLPQQLVTFQQSRHYAKAKKGGKKGGKKGKKAEVVEEEDPEDAEQAESPEEVDIQQVINEKLDRGIGAAVDYVADELNKLRTGRAHPGLIESIPVELYGSTMPLRDVATVAVRDAQVLSVMVYDKDSQDEVEKAISKCALGLNPSSGGDTILVPIPIMDEEQKKEIYKMAKSHGEKGKGSVRARRQEALKAIKAAEKKGGMSKDDMKRFEKQVQALHDKAVKEIDAMCAAKHKELME